MSGETGVQESSPRPSAVAEDFKEEPVVESSDTTKKPAADNSAGPDLATKTNNVTDQDTDDVQEVTEVNHQETTKLLDEEEMPTYTSLTEGLEVDEKKERNTYENENKDDDRNSFHSCSTDVNKNDDSDNGDTKDSSIDSDTYQKKWEKVSKKQSTEESDLEKEYASDEDDDEDMMDEEEEYEDEELDEEDEIDENDDYGDDDIQVVEVSNEEDECVKQTNVERAASEDYESRAWGYNVLKLEYQGKKSQSFQDLSNPNLLSKPKRNSPIKQTVSNQENIVAKSLKSSYSKPGPKSYHHIQSKVKQYICDIKSKSAEDKRKIEERKLMEKQQIEKTEKDEKSHPKFMDGEKIELKQLELKETHKLAIQALQSEYAKANSEHDFTFASLKPIPAEHVMSDVRIIRINKGSSDTVQKMEVDDENVSSSGRNNVNVNGATKDVIMDYQSPSNISNGQQDTYRMNYKDYMRSGPNYDTAQALAQERAKTAAQQKQIEQLKKQLEQFRRKEVEQRKVMRDMAVQTEEPVKKDSETVTSISDWSESKNCSVPSIDSSSQTIASNISQNMVNTFKSASRFMETFAMISRRLKEDETGPIMQNPRKRKIDNLLTDEPHPFKMPHLNSSKTSKQDETGSSKVDDVQNSDQKNDIKCYIYKEDENKSERSLLIQIDDPNVIPDSNTKVDRKCGPYLIGNVEIMMSELNGTINVWGKEVNQSQSTETSVNNSTSTVEEVERHKLRARRTANPPVTCSTEKKLLPPDYDRLRYMNSCHHCHRNRQRGCGRIEPADYYSYHHKPQTMSCCKRLQPPTRCDCYHPQDYYEQSCGHARDRRHQRYDTYVCHPKLSPDDDDGNDEDEYDHIHQDMGHTSRCCRVSEKHKLKHKRYEHERSQTWQPRSPESPVYNGKLDSGVHSDSPSNHDDEYVPVMKKRRPPVKSFLNLLKRCGGDANSSSSSYNLQKNIPKIIKTAPSTSDIVEDAKCDANFMYTDFEHRVKGRSEVHRLRPNMLNVKNHNSEADEN